MKLTAFLIAFVMMPLTYAATGPQGHWTAKFITCSSGTIPYPGIYPWARMDYHFFDDNQIEGVYTRPEDWAIIRGTYSNTDKQVCFDIHELIASREASHAQPFKPYCWDYQATPQELVLRFLSDGNGTDCPAGDVLSIYFDPMKAP